MGRPHPAGTTGLCEDLLGPSLSSLEPHGAGAAPIFVAPEVPAGGGGQTRR
jgi:hypothetical protein